MNNKFYMMRKHCIYIPFAIVFFSIMKPFCSNAQGKIENDTSYYVTYPDKLTVRTYLSQKYAHFTLPALDDKAAQDLEYKSNSKLSMGAGVTYHNFSLNVGYGAGFLNKDNEKGTTKTFDLQLHVYYHNKWVIDALGMFYHGYYLEKDSYTTNGNNFYTRPDIQLNLIGAAAYRLSNPERFSYHAAMTQNEWQKRSAGTLLYGGEAYYGVIKGDSALVPQQLGKNYPQDGINNINFFRVGPGIGYAYTLVMQKHFFATASLVGNLDFTASAEDGINGNNKKITLNPGLIYKAAIGYNSDSWGISATWAGNAAWLSSDLNSEKYFLPTGNYRIILAKKINIKKH